MLVEYRQLNMGRRGSLWRAEVSSWAGLAGGWRPGDEGKENWAQPEEPAWGLAFGVGNGGVVP